MGSSLAVLVISPFIGSFLGVLIHRLPQGAPVLLARSACESCRHPLTPRDLLPLVSFAMLRGRCRICQAPIRLFHPMVELAALAIGAVSVLADGPTPRVWADAALGWALLALAWIDWQHLRLPDVLTLPLLLAGLAVTQWLQPDALTSHAAAAVLGYLAFRGVALAYRTWRQREGLGAGDAKLLAAAGAWLGYAALPGMVFVAAILGLLAAAWLAVRGRKLAGSTALPFGPCLAVAFWVVWLCQGFAGPWLLPG